MVVTVYSDKCNGIDSCPLDGLCMTVCALDAIENIGGMPVIIEEKCNTCGLCVMNCPNEALSK